MIFNNQIQVMFGSIVSLQVLAHLPLANIVLPANAMSSFDVLVQIVSFDYFPIAEVFNMGFTPTPAFTPNFEYLGYETYNFIENMGSIILFMWIGGLFFLYLVISKVCGLT